MMTSRHPILTFYPPSILVQMLSMILLSCCWQVRSLVSPYMIIDLQSNSSGFFANELLRWSYSTTPTYSNCAGLYLMETPNLYGGLLGRQYYSLAPHNSVYITISLYFIDGWYHGYDSLAINFLNVNYTVTQTFTVSPLVYNYLPGYVCGNYVHRGDIDNATVIIESSHTSSWLGLSFNIQTGQQWLYNRVGIRDIKIFASNRVVSSPSLCVQSNYPSVFSGLTCQCPFYQYQDSSGICSNCHSTCATCFGSTPTSCLSCAPGLSFNGTACIVCDGSCKTCFGPLPNQCLTCHQGNFLFTNNTCSSTCLAPFSSYNYEYTFYSRCTCASGTYYYKRNNTCNSGCPAPAFRAYYETYNYTCEFKCDPGFYYYKNGSCLATCDPDFIPVNSGEYLFCNFPCAANRYLYWNGTCSTCKSPLLLLNITGYLYCKYPCLNHESLYWDGSCQPKCDFPLHSKVEGGKNFCTFPCSIMQFLNWNGTCGLSCRSPYVVEVLANRKFCNLPCLQHTFLFENGSCINSCQFPLIQSLNETINTCRRPCQLPNIYYYPDDKTCKSSCRLPYKLNETDLSMSCELPLSAEEKKQVQSISSVNSGTSEATQGAVSVGVVASADPGGMSSSMLTKMLQYTRYLNITYSAKLEMMFKTTNLKTGFIPFLPPIYENIKENFEYTNVPFTFAKFNVHSSFLVNFWDGFISLGIALGLWINFKIVEFTSSKLGKCVLPYRIFSKIRMTIQNFVIAQFYNSYSDILMFSAIEIRTNHLGSLAEVLSFCTSFLLVGLGFIVIYVHYELLMGYQRLRIQSLKDKQKREELKENFNKENEGMKILFLNFKDNSFIHQSFFLLLNVRNSLFALLVGFMFDYPIGQVSILTFFTVSTVIYLFLKRPFVSIVNFIQQLFGDVMLLIVNICLIKLVSLDLHGETQLETRETPGQVIILCNMAIGFVAPFFAVAKGIVAVYNFIQLRKKNANLNKLKQLSVNKPKRIDNPQKGKGKRGDFDTDQKALKGESYQAGTNNTLINNETKGNKTTLDDEIPGNSLETKSGKAIKKPEPPKNSWNLNLRTPFARAVRLMELSKLGKKSTPQKDSSDKTAEPRGLRSFGDLEVADFGDKSLNMSSLQLIQAEAKKEIDSMLKHFGDARKEVEQEELSSPSQAEKGAVMQLRIPKEIINR